MKFNKGDRVVVKNALPDTYAGRLGIVHQMWPQIFSGGRNQFQYYVCLDGHGNTALVFNEDQLDLAVLDQLARIG
jgi:hypothetical protein